LTGQTTFRGSLRVYGAQRAIGTLNCQPATTPPLLALQVDGAPSRAAQPRDGAFVISGIEVYVGGVLVPLERMLGPWSVKLTIEAGQNLQEWAFSTSILGGVGYFGSPYDKQGCPFGAATVDIVGVYLLPTGPVRYPLISGGIGDNTHRVGSLTEGYFETHNGTCKLGRFDGIPITLIEPEGNGRTRDQVIQDAFGLVGIPIGYALSGMHSVHKELQFVDAMPIQLAQELADVESRRVVVNVAGELTNPQATARFGYAIAGRFEERDLIAATQVETTDHQAVVTDVTLVSSQTIVQPPGSADTGRTVSPLQETDIKGALAIGKATYIQNPDGTLATLTGGGDILVPLGLKIRTATQTESQFGVTLRQLSYVELYRWLQAARYEWEAGGVLSAISGAYLDGTATAHGTEPAYGEPGASWRRDTESVQATFWDEDGLAGPVGSGALGPWGYRLAGHAGPGEERTGRQLGSLTIKRGWYLPRRAVKQAVPGTSWEAINPILGRKILGNGEGVGDGEEVYQDLQWVVVTLEGDDAGALRVQTTWTLGFGRPVGGAWWFQSTGPSAVEEEAWGVLSQEVITYAPVTTTSYQQITARFDGQGAPLGDVSIETKAGAPPQIPVLQQRTTGADGSVTTGVSQQIKVRVIAANLEEGGGSHLKKMVKTAVAFPESIDELADVGISIIEQSAAGQVDFTTMANFQLHPGMFVHLTYRPDGIDHDMQITTVLHSGVGGAPGGANQIQPAISAWTCTRYPLVATGGS
jgi:hypothetical protein